jgi:argininosuccinate synthase
MEQLLQRANALAGEYPQVKKVALSYSGGLDSSVVGTLLSRAGFQVLPIVMNIGQQSDFSRKGNVRLLHARGC